MGVIMNANNNEVKKQYSVVVFLGRLEPVHVAHVASIMEAFKHGEYVIVGLGTANSPRTPKNPWTVQERMEMVLAAIPTQYHHRLAFIGLEDFIYSDSEWVTNTASLIKSTARQLVGTDDDIAILAHKKDSSTYYIDYFKFLKAIIPFDEVKLSDSSAVISATKIRDLIFTGYIDWCQPVLAQGTLEWLKNWIGSEAHQYVQSEYDAALEYEHQFKNAPYGNTNFYTADSVVIQSGHILLVKRGKAPGKDLWALPGGHVNNNETAFQASLRELEEETKIKVPRKVLIGSMFEQKLFDDPDRSLRCRISGKYGRTVTVAHGYKLNDSEPLPRVRGADDAADAKWVPIDVFLNEMRDQVFEDHRDLAEYFIKRIPDERAKLT